MVSTVLVRYGELALKSAPVRREFEQRLQQNILEQFRVEGRTCRLRADHGHLYVTADDGEAALRVLGRVFGVTSASEVVEVATETSTIREGLLRYADAALRPGSSFGVRARRTGQHGFTSQELARDLGAAVLQRWPERSLRVDLEHPDVELNVEVRGPRTYLYLGRTPGPGGLPVGVAGRVVSLVDGPRGALGAYLMMKRGCRCTVVATEAGEPLAREVLARFDPRVTVRSEAGAVEPVLQTVAEEARAEGLVLPLAVEDYPAARARWGDRVVFSPTVGLSDDEVNERWGRIAAVAH
ncbi:MAG TPA: THUMP domain-containing protein [Thermoplasmata archaeon]|nr:THUMP domain-containing protein [Thermoplasmata archaeon]